MPPRSPRDRLDRLVSALDRVARYQPRTPDGRARVARLLSAAIPNLPGGEYIRVFRGGMTVDRSRGHDDPDLRPVIDRFRRLASLACDELGRTRRGRRNS